MWWFSIVADAVKKLTTIAASSSLLIYNLSTCFFWKVDEAVDIWVEAVPATLPPVGEFAWASPYFPTGGRALSDSDTRHSANKVTNSVSSVRLLLDVERIVFEHRLVPPECQRSSNTGVYITKPIWELMGLSIDGR